MEVKNCFFEFPGKKGSLQSCTTCMWPCVTSESPLKCSWPVCQSLPEALGRQCQILRHNQMVNFRKYICNLRWNSFTITSDINFKILLAVVVNFKIFLSNLFCFRLSGFVKQKVDQLSLIGSYGLFRRMTGVGGRPEIVIEGANSRAGPWKEYEFMYKPGNVSVAPRFCLPHQPR